MLIRYDYFNNDECKPDTTEVNDLPELEKIANKNDKQNYDLNKLGILKELHLIINTIAEQNCDFYDYGFDEIKRVGYLKYYIRKSGYLVSKDTGVIQLLEILQKADVIKIETIEHYIALSFYVVVTE